MKNLKKLLAVVLVIALAFSVMATAVAANVDDYSDFDDVTYVEAVDVFTALGFLAGMGDGSFDPTGLVTREQAAKIITYMLIGTERADALTTTVSSFSDVAVSRWSAPFIEYCAALGIINGRGDGTFDPAGNVTAVEFAKMLLCAVGYGENDEYTGANWAMKTIADAQSKGILVLAVDYTAAATREQCALYGFMAYTSVAQVVYNGNTQSYQNAYDTTGAGINIAAGSLAAVQGVTTTAAYVLDGVTVYNWTKNGFTLTGPYTVDDVMGTSTNGTSLANLTNPFASSFIAATDANTSFFYNGTLDVTAAAPTAPVLAAIATRGVIVTFINNDTDTSADSVLVIEKTVTVLSSAPIVNATSGRVTIPDICTNALGGTVTGYDGLVAGDVVLWYVDSYGVTNIELADSITGTMTAYNNAYLTGTVNGDTMTNTGLTPSAATTLVTLGMWAAGGMYNVDSTFYLDDNGSVVYIKSNVAVPANEYGLVLDYAYYGSFANAAQVKLFTQDGVMGIYDVAAGTTGIVPDQTATYITPGSTGYLCRYVEYADGTVSLFATDVTGAAITTASALTVAYGAGDTTYTDGTGVYTITSTTPVFYFDPTVALGAGNYPAVTTGFASTNAAIIGDTVSYGETAAANYTAGVLFEFSATVSATTGYAYVMSVGFNTVPQSGVNYYEYTVYVDGAVTTLTSLDATLFGATGLWLYTTDAAGYVNTTATPATIIDESGLVDTVSAIGAATFSYNLGVNTYVTDSNTAYYWITTSGGVETGMVANPLAVGYDIEWVQVDSVTGVAEAVYYYV